MIIFEKDEVFTQQDDSTFKKYTFEVPDDAARIDIFMKYSPSNSGDAGLDEVIKTLRTQAPYLDAEKEAHKFLPLKNHISVSLDAPDGWKGTLHRFSTDCHYFITSNDASAGLIPTTIKSGIWSITLSINSLVSNKVNLSLRAECGSGEKLEVSK